jgi:N-acyl-L-homoserine lactone synthetase
MDRLHSPTVLAALDEVTRRGVARAAPVRYGVARTDAERDAVYRLRYRVVVERGWARPEDLPDGRERDAYDAVAVHVVGWDGETLAAAARLLFPSESYRLPTEAAFDVLVEPRGQVADMGREIVARTHTDARHRIFAGLLGQCWIEARARGFCHLCGVFTPSMVRLFHLMGIEIAVLGPARPFWGEERQPILFVPEAAAEALIRKWGPPAEN